MLIFSERYEVCFSCFSCVKKCIFVLFFYSLWLTRLWMCDLYIRVPRSMLFCWRTFHSYFCHLFLYLCTIYYSCSDFFITFTSTQIKESLPLMWLAPAGCLLSLTSLLVPPPFPPPATLQLQNLITTSFSEIKCHSQWWDYFYGNTKKCQSFQKEKAL